MSAFIQVVITPHLSRSKALALTGLAAGMIGSLALAAISFGVGNEVLPNLKVNLAPYSANSTYVDFTINGRPLYRFDTRIENTGSGAFETYRNPAGQLYQIVYGTGGGPVTDQVPGPGLQLNASLAPADANESARYSIPEATTWAGDNHQHWHVQEVAEYYLSVDGTKYGSAKVGFCFYDSNDPGAIYGGYTEPSNDWCQHLGGVGAPIVRWGISPGGFDLYGSSLANQWIDIDAVPPGNYPLIATVDPNARFKEEVEGDNTTQETRNIPGVAVSDLATPAFRVGSGNNVVVLPLATAGGANVLVKNSSAPPRAYSPSELAAGLKYYVTVDPTNGTLSSEDGDRTFNYTPKPGFVGTDTFQYLAHDPRGFDSKFATITVKVASVAVTPNSPRIDAGQSQQFTATTSANLSGGVTWAVDGVAGGDSIVGTVTAAGLYTAPAAKGSHVIRATSTTTSGVYGESPVDVGVSPAVAISPKTGALLTGQSLQFSSTVTDSPPPVSYSVNGVAGGDASVGTISAAGLYTAPAAAPKSQVTVRATLTGRPLVFDEATLSITAPVVPVVVAPVPPTTTTGKPGGSKVAKRLARIIIVGKSGKGVRVRVKLDRSLNKSQVTIQARGAKRKYTSWIGTRRAVGTTINLVLPLRGRNAVSVRAYVRSGKRKVFSSPVVISAKPTP